jgi:hypothetical protein
LSRWCNRAFETRISEWFEAIGLLFQVFRRSFSIFQLVFLISHEFSIPCQRYRSQNQYWFLALVRSFSSHVSRVVSIAVVQLALELS